jgi:phytoene dehydrogenase-like protein
MDGIPRALRFPVAPLKINGKPIWSLTKTHYSYEPDFAPGGSTLITVSINQFDTDYDSWNALARDSTAYHREKTRIGEEVIGAIVTRFPQMKGKLNLLDVATPKTFERYCNAYRGAFMPFLPTVGGKMMAHTGRIKGLKNILLSGQWLQPPGGLPVALITGKDTIMRLCKMKRQLFIY